jgi:hypothetical protein
MAGEWNKRRAGNVTAERIRENWYVPLVCGANPGDYLASLRAALMAEASIQIITRSTSSSVI